MTEAQKIVLQKFNSTRTGAICFFGRWIFPQHVREDANLAEKLVHAWVNEGR